MIKYRISRTALEGWVRTIRKHGYEELHIFRHMARSKKKEYQTELEKLQAENPGTSQWVEAIDELRSEYPLDLLLELRRIAHSVFYYHLERLEGQDKYAVEKEEIKSIFHHNGVYHNLYVNSSRHSNSCKHSEIVLLPTQTGMLMYITSI